MSELWNDSKWNFQVLPKVSALQYNTSSEAKISCLVEDMDWTVQLHRKGEKVVQALDAIIYTQDPATLKQLWGQIQRWHRGTWQVVRARKLCYCFWCPSLPITRIDSEFLLILGEALFYGFMLLLLPLWFWLSPHRALWAVVADQGVLLFFVLLTALRDKRWDVIYMFPLFFIPRVMSYVSFVYAYLMERYPQKDVKWFKPERW